MEGNPTSASRQLAAIMFTDIVGYTAIMQENEQNAVDVIKHYNTALEKYVAHYHGRILNYYGDGSLCIFASSAEAVNCAVDVQKEMRVEPVVPLRIGLHVGEIFFENGQALGDSINVASRIQSLGLANTILTSAEFHNKISNHPTVKATSIGDFDFKNVALPVEVFALTNDGLTIPARKEMRGKLKTRVKRLGPLGIVISVTVMLAVGILVRRSFTHDNILADSIRTARVAVLPFDNKTNDPQLDMFGFMAADWITQSLLDATDVKVVMFQTAQNHLDYANVFETDDDQISFSDRTGASVIIRGSFYLQNDALLVQSQLIDARTGEVELILPQIEGTRSDLQALVRELSSRFVAYYESKDVLDVQMGLPVPTYEAYSKWHEVIAAWDKMDMSTVRKILSESIALDSSFMLPYTMARVTYSNASQWKEADSIQRLIERRFQRSTPFQRDLIAAGRAVVDGDLPEMYRAYASASDKDPKNVDYNMWAAASAFFNWHYSDALRRVQHIDPATVSFQAGWNAVWARLYAHLLLVAGHDEEARKVIQYVPGRYFVLAAPELANMYARRHQDDSLRMLSTHLPANLRLPMINKSFNEWVAGVYAVQGDTTNQIAWAKMAAQGFESATGSSQQTPSSVYYLAGNYERALSAVKAEIAARGTNWQSLARLGCTYVQLDQPEKAHETLRVIASSDNQYAHGDDQYAMAEILTALGEKSKAVECLRRAYQQGKGMSFGLYAEDFDLTGLRDYKPFEELVSPKN